MVAEEAIGFGDGGFWADNTATTKGAEVTSFDGGLETDILGSIL